MFGEILRWALLFLYGTTLIAVGLYGLHRYHLVFLYIAHRHRAHRAPANFRQLPRVTIQLPMFNESAVAVRIIDAVAELDYPTDRLQIQVLDDSTDETRDLARAAVERWASKGIDIEYIHRTDRVGYKAGALADAMPRVTGEFIAIFDADFIPTKTVLREIISHFADPSVGMVQTRWEHLNRDASMLTRGQAIFLDGHFVIEHAARNWSGRFMHFNGTAGVWRKSCIEDSGGWQHDTLTEDLDLSYRAQLRGWRFVYLPQYCSPAELPPEMLAFKQQAHRWTKGAIQTAIKLLPSILKSKTLSTRVKSEAFFHLTNPIVYPLVLLMTLLMYPVFIFAGGPLKHHPLASCLFGFTVFAIATCSAGAFFCYAQRVLFGPMAFWRTVCAMPYLIALGVGLGVNNTRAVIEAFTTRGRGRNEFVRTPKYGSGSNRTVKFSKAACFPVSKLLTAVVEIAFGCYMLCFIIVSMVYAYALPAVPFLMIFAAGYFYVGFSTLKLLAATSFARPAEEVVPVKSSVAT